MASSPRRSDAGPAPVPAPVRRADAELIETLGLHGKSRAAGLIVRGAILLALIGAVAYGVQRYREREAKNAEPTYKTAAVTRENVQVTITATGTLKGLNTVEVGAEVSGKVTVVHVDWNDRVEKGQVLAELDPEQARATLDEATARVSEAEASIRQARATLVEAKQTAARATTQIGQGLVSQRELEAANAAEARADANLASAKASLVVARAALNSARSRLEKTTIRSPIDGMVLSRTVEPGQTVTASLQTPVLFKLAEDLERLSLNVFIDESDVGRAKEGLAASFTVDAYPARVFPSKVLSLRNEAKVEQNVVTYEAVLAVDNHELLLRPGMTATATIVAETHRDVVAVPNAALRWKPEVPKVISGFNLRPRAPKQAPPPAAKSARRVFVLEGGVPKPITIKTGASDGRVTEVVGDTLAPGRQVIVDAIDKANEAGTGR
jgi:HlyD family secretion protein